MQKHTLNDREILCDALSSEKFMTENYNNYANECASPSLMNEFMNLLLGGAPDPARCVHRDAETRLVPDPAGSCRQGPAGQDEVFFPGKFIMVKEKSPSLQGGRFCFQQDAQGT